ncbi:putative CYB2-lactate dehydrogenase cytochrome b2 [Pyrenophora seminiperda CCB06]|uniref:Putative CYB2-lactate dehydrogenase cytochrome b2 n=1 Tax=Pyrenophora seminiperda CCB06 TaxID=1302712 RepID=A0A3M7MJF8_9PLEO|nr:putative CYB2-lactate dehydrogenase cytochrome b2 [Pyrenophora seminiperda CCB06]
MRVSIIAFASCALAARPFLDEPDTGIDGQLAAFVANKTLPPVDSLVGLPDFQWVGRNYMNTSSFAYYRNGAAGEWSYRNNLEIFQRFRLRPRFLTDITNVPNTMPTTILGHNFSAPIFISPCARGGYANEAGEVGLAKGAGEAGILYMPSLYSSIPMKDIYAARDSTSQVMFQQIYLSGNLTQTKALFDQAKALGAKGLILTIDAAGDAIRHRAARFGVGSANTELTKITWELFHQLQNMTDLPIIPKGIQTVEDAQAAVKNGVKAIFLSNHGGRQIDGSPSTFQVAMEIHQKDPGLFKQVEVYADGGIRYGTDIIKMLSLGVKAVGVGRPFMFANIYGAAGVKKAADLLKNELVMDAANMGVSDLKNISPDLIDWRASSEWVGNDSM